MTPFPFSNGPFDGQTLPVDMIDTPRGPVAREEVRLEWVKTSLGPVPRFVEEGGEAYRREGEGYVWITKGDDHV